MKDQICTILLYDVQTKLTVGSRECCVPNNPLFFDNHFFSKWSPPLLVVFFFLCCCYLHWWVFVFYLFLFRFFFFFWFFFLINEKNEEKMFYPLFWRNEITEISWKFRIVQALCRKESCQNLNYKRLCFLYEHIIMKSCLWCICSTI